MDHKKTLRDDPEIIKALRDKETYGIPDYVYQAWRAQRNNSKRRNIPFNFTLLGWRIWWDVQLKSKGPDAKKGNRRGQYIMCRIDDSGPYEDGNVYCGTPQNNMDDIPPIVRFVASELARRTRKEHGVKPGLKVRGDDHHRSKAAITPKGRFGSIALAAEAYGLTRAGMSLKIRRNIVDGIPGWTMENEDDNFSVNFKQQKIGNKIRLPRNYEPPGQHLKVRGDGHPRSKAVITPAGRFGSIALAAEHYNLSRAGGCYRIKKGEWSLE